MSDTSRRPRVFVLGAVLGMMAAASSCTSDGTNSVGVASPAPAVPVAIATVQQRDVPVQIRAIGTVEAYSTVSVTPQVDGQLAQVHFQEGQWVKKDDMLFTIDPRPFEATLRQAEANLARHNAEANNAGVEAKRKGRLLVDGFVSADENDQAQTNAAAMRAEVSADEAAVENAKLQLQFCHIRSPIDGRVGQLLIHEGNVVKKNETRLAVINQVRPIYVTFSVREQDLPEIRKHSATSELVVDATPSKSAGEPAVGKLRFINNTVDATTGTVLLKAEFANDDERLWPGQFADVELTLAIEHDAVVLPAGAVLKGQQGAYVFVVKPDDTVEIRSIVIGMDLGSELTVHEGVKAGERVVTDGQIRLAPGFKVEIKKPAANA